jgi:hypothetical protein
MMGKEFEGELFEHPIFSSFELMTGLAIVCMGIVFGIYLLDLWGFVPLIPVHLFGFKKQRLLIWMVAFCLIGTIVVTGALGIFRYFAITQPAEIIESSRTGDISSPFDIDGGNTIPPDFEASIEPTTEMSVVEKIAVAISLVGIPVLALVGVALSFNGVAVLAMFLILGGIATVSGGVALLAVFARLFHHLLVFIFSVIYVLFNALTGMTGMIAAPFVQAFCLRGTDPPPDAGQGNAPDPPQGHYPPPQQPLQPEHTTEAGQQDSDPNATDTESSETSRRSDENQQPFTPSDRDWNPLE